VSRRESDREDLLREATALVERAELTIPEFPDSVVVGFRQGGSASVYFGADEAYHFNTAGELRRAYLGGLLYKAEAGRLVSLKRQRGEATVALVRAELDVREAADLLTRLQCRLTQLRQSLADASFTLVGQVPANIDVVQRTGAWFATFQPQIRIAQAPNAG
jgi:hypothetical protein